MKRNKVEKESCEMNLFSYLIESADFRFQYEDYYIASVNVEKMNY